MWHYYVFASDEENCFVQEEGCCKEVATKENCSNLRDLEEDKEFTDVTLACRDGQHVEAHKVVLIATNPFFVKILRRNQHPHPLIYTSMD